jgi:MFS family permease
VSYDAGVFHGDVGRLYIWWMGVWASMHRGYWFVASLYLVLDAHLSALQLVTIGVVQSVISGLFEVPAGVVADTFSRKWSLVFAHLLMGAAIVLTGSVRSFPALVTSQALWGIAWTFASGSDIAWIADELASPSRIDRVLISAARAKSVGAAVGIVVFGVLARSASRSTAIIATGIGIFLLGLFVTRIPEAGFVRPTRTRLGSLTIFRKGLALARTDRILIFAFIATMLTIGGAGEGFNRMYTKQLTNVGFPNDHSTMVWFGLLNLATLAGGAMALHLVERKIDDPDTARRAFATSCVLAAIGVTVLAVSGNVFLASVGAVLTGIALLVARAVCGVWVNRRVTSDVRATVHSLLQQAEYAGEAALTLGLGVLAGWASITIGLLGSALFFLITAFMLRASIRK